MNQISLSEPLLETPLLEMRGISKSFPGVKALDDVNIALYAGKVTALIGENGAGKSTLVKILTGIYESDEGEIHVDGTPVTFANAQHAIDFGVTAIHQETVLFDELAPYRRDPCHRRHLHGARGLDIRGRIAQAGGAKLCRDESGDGRRFRHLRNRVGADRTARRCADLLHISGDRRNARALEVCFWLGFANRYRVVFGGCGPERDGADHGI